MVEGVVHLVAVLAASCLSSRMGLERGLRLQRPTTITLGGVEVKRGGCMIVVMCIYTHVLSVSVSCESVHDDHLLSKRASTASLQMF